MVNRLPSIVFPFLTSTRPPLEIPPLPLLFYFFYDDVEAVVGALAAAGVRITRTGHPRTPSAAR
jgi:hypothetical protein